MIKTKIYTLQINDITIQPISEYQKNDYIEKEITTINLPHGKDVILVIQSGAGTDYLLITNPTLEDIARTEA